MGSISNFRGVRHAAKKLDAHDLHHAVVTLSHLIMSRLA